MVQIAQLFAAKMARILALYDQPPTDGRVLCVDEFGPLNLQPRPDQAGLPRGQPVRRRATYTRTAGVRQMFAALDPASGQLFYRFPRPQNGGRGSSTSTSNYAAASRPDSST